MGEWLPGISFSLGAHFSSVGILPVTSTSSCGVAPVMAAGRASKP